MAATSSVRLDAKGVEAMRKAAADRGLTLRQYLEALMHFGLSVENRPGSWEAQSFEVSAYVKYDGTPNHDSCRDRWF